MTLRELYNALAEQFGEHSDPDRWWPIYYGYSDPPAFERVITSVLVQRSSWRSVRPDVDRLAAARLLTARALADATPERIAACITRSGLALVKGERLHAVGRFVVDRFGDEAAFCERVRRDELLRIHGLGEQTVARIRLYTCGRLAWPTDTYCLRVLGHRGVIHVPDRLTAAGLRQVTAEVTALVEAEMSASVVDWQRLHALMQLEGERLGQRGAQSTTRRSTS